MDHHDKEYTIGWICALPVELAAAVAVLDERNPPLTQDDHDDNVYEFGRIGQYNIIIACLPSGVYGTTSAAEVAISMRKSFPSVTAGLMVGIGGGAPSSKNDIRLGDVVVSEPGNGFGGVIQYDFGKTIQEGRFIQTGFLNKPPNAFLKAISKLKAERLLHQQDYISSIIATALANTSSMDLREFVRPDPSTDLLYKSFYDHPEGHTSCDQCDIKMLVERSARPNPSRQESDTPYVHYGLIASGNQVMRHGPTRDKISQEKGVLCFEMEAAGIMCELPSLVIRGICDYSDSHKTKTWQPYAALAAAAFAKTLLLQLPSRERIFHSWSNQPQVDQIQAVDLGLPIAKKAAFGSYDEQAEPECLPGTRVALLNQIQQWVDGVDNIASMKKTIFWLVGNAGTGKSTISRTISKRFRLKNQLAARFFFQRGEADSSNSSLLFTTIAFQLAEYYRSLTLKIQEAMKLDQDLQKASLGEQFEKLIFRPLSEMTRSSVTSIIIIDALDECEPIADRRTIIRLLFRLADVKTVDLRVFLTSRPDVPIGPTFRGMPEDLYNSIVLHEVPDIRDDIQLFLRDRLNEIRETNSLSRDWPGVQRLHKLVEMSSPLFIYAATLCRFIADEDWDPEERLESILTYQTGWQVSQLHKTYLPILDRLSTAETSQEISRMISEFRQIVGTVINLANPLSIPALASLLSVKRNFIATRLKHFSSVLNVPNDLDTDCPITIFHLSFRDFLVGQELQNRSQFWINEKESHLNIAKSCLELMSNKLKKDICCLKSPGILREEIDDGLIDTYLPPELKYACRYWVHHLVQSGTFLVDDNVAHAFLQQHLLHWLEAMSLSRNTTETVISVDSLTSIIDMEKGKILFALVKDIKRFVVQTRQIINLAPLQTYSSAITFIPSNSVVRQLYSPEKIAKWIKKLPIVADDWSSLVQTLEIEDELLYISKLAVSWDGKILASSLKEMGNKAAHPIKLWDTFTGAPLQTLLGDIKVSALGFTRNDAILVSASKNLSLVLWEVATGLKLRIINHPNIANYAVNFNISGYGPVEADKIVSLAFSHDLLATGSRRGKVELWDLRTWTIQWTINSPYQIDHNSVHVAFLGNDQILAAKYFSRVKVWEVATNTQLYQYEIEQGYGDISPDGRQFLFMELKDNKISKSKKGRPKLWNISSGSLGPLCTPLQARYREYEEVWCHAFSRTSKLLAISDYRTIQVWCTTTGETVAIFHMRMHRGLRGAISLAFIGDTLLASGHRLGDHFMLNSHRSTIRIWEIPSRSTTRGFQGVNSEKYPERCKGQLDLMEKAKFSPDGKVLATSAMPLQDDTIPHIAVWDGVTGSLMHILNPNDYVRPPKGYRPLSFGLEHSLYSGRRYLATGPHNRRHIIIWELSTTRTLGARIISITLNSPKDKLNILKVSPNGKFLFVGSLEGVNRLWNVATGELSLNLPQCYVRRLIFDRDSSIIVCQGRAESGSPSTPNLRIWCVATGAPLGGFKQFGSYLIDASISFGGKFMAVQMAEVTGISRGTGRIRIFESGTWMPLQDFTSEAEIEYGGEIRNQNFAFSTDGQSIMINGKSFPSRPKRTSALPVQHSLQVGTADHGHVDSLRMLENGWLTWRHERIFWLPSEYRVDIEHLDIYKNKIALGGDITGFMSLIEFDFEPTSYPYGP